VSEDRPQNTEFDHNGEMTQFAASLLRPAGTRDC